VTNEDGDNCRMFAKCFQLNTFTSTNGFGQQSDYLTFKLSTLWLSNLWTNRYRTLVAAQVAGKTGSDWSR